MHDRPSRWGITTHKQKDTGAVYGTDGWWEARAGIWGGTMPACDLWAERAWRMGSWGQERISVAHQVVALGGVGWVYWQECDEITGKDLLGPARKTGMMLH